MPCVSGVRSSRNHAADWRRRDSPGPSAYYTDVARGNRQVLSDHHSEPAFSMGSSCRSDPAGSKQSASMPGVGEFVFFGCTSASAQQSCIAL